MKKFEDLDEVTKKTIGYHLSNTSLGGLGEAFELLEMWEESSMCDRIEECISQLYGIFEDYIY